MTTSYRIKKFFGGPLNTSLKKCRKKIGLTKKQISFVQSRRLVCMTKLRYIVQGKADKQPSVEGVFGAYETRR